MQANTPRPRCPDCNRPTSHCLCPLISPQPSATQLLVIQHPDESRHALNTARLLTLGLDNAQLLVCEELPPEWQAWLTDPHWQTRLLFPRPDAQPLDSRSCPAPLRLVLLDGTWRKARKLLHVNLLLQQLPAVLLDNPPTSRYRLRKASEAGALSTIEAAAEALAALEPGFERERLLRPFEALINDQIRAMGDDVWQRNYR
ncbi:MAG: DTW domain-containing protein [Halopseudomonas yangmingensis]